MITGSKAKQEIGVAKTVLVPHEGRAVISAVTAHPRAHPFVEPLAFRGSAFETPVKRHLDETVLAHVHDIMEALNIPLSSFTLSARNIGAASASGIGISVRGFSIDVSAFLAILSCALRMPISQDILFTGHLGSQTGEILPVESLVAKCEAALADEGVSQFVYPSLESDASFKHLKPSEYGAATAAIRSCRGRVKLHEVTTTLELLHKCVETQAIVLSALRSGFFDAENDAGENAHPVAAYLTRNNQKRFWDTLEKNLLAEDFKAGRNLMQAFIEYHRDRRRYPSGFGEKLSQLVISLPSHVKRAPGFTPLLPKEPFIRLIQFASTERDQEDMSLLHDALYGVLTKRSAIVASRRPQRISGERNSVMERLLDQLDPEYIESTVTRPYDEARTRYVIDTITVASNPEFLDAMTAFYTHMCRHTNRIHGAIDKTKLGGEVLVVLKNTFKGKSGYNDALAEARCGTHGGLRYIMDRVTEYLKEDAREKHIFRTFKENIDPLDYDARVKSVEELLNLVRDHLPEEITSQPPEKFAEDYEEIVKAYVQSTTGLKTILRRL